MTSQFQFEFEHKMRDGRLVSCIGTASVAHACDCAGEAHDHIYAIEMQDVQQLYDDGSVQGWEIEEGSRAMHELSLAAERHVYAELKELAEEVA